MPKKTSAHCPNCNGKRSCKIHGSTTQRFEQDFFWEETVYSLLECRGCETVFFHQSATNSEEWEDEYDHAEERSYACHTPTVQTFPHPGARERPEWVAQLEATDHQLRVILEQMYLASEGGSAILAAIGLRTALDRATELLEIDTELSFRKKLDKLLETGRIGQNELEQLEVVTDAGNAAAHRGWSPDADQLRKLIGAMELFLRKAFIEGGSALEMKGSIPRRSKALPAPDKMSSRKTPL